MILQKQQSYVILIYKIVVEISTRGREIIFVNGAVFPGRVKGSKPPLIKNIS